MGRFQIYENRLRTTRGNRVGLARLVYACALAWFLMVGFSLQSSPGDTINPEKFDHVLLEKLVLNEVNAFREEKGVQPVLPNEKLFLAAEDQANYIAKIGKLSHSQPNAKKAKTRDRVEFYGAKMRGVGENTAYVKLFTNAIYKGEGGGLDTLVIDTYELAAKYLALSWINSPPHNANMQFEHYEFSGLKVVYRANTKSLYAVQVFGFDFDE